MKKSRTHRTSPQEDGFTLIEVLVSLAILGVSLAVLLGVFARNLDTTARSERAMQARVLAQSLLAEAQSTASPRTMTGETASGLTWQLAVSPYASGKDARSDMQAAKISARVSWDSGEGKKTLSLSTLRFVAAGTKS